MRHRMSGPRLACVARVNVRSSWRRSRRLCHLMLGGGSARCIRQLDRRHHNRPSRRRPSPTPIPTIQHCRPCRHADRWARHGHASAAGCAMGSAPPPAEGEGVEVVNRSDGGFFYWLLQASTPSACCAGWACWSWRRRQPTSTSPRTLPTLPDIATYHRRRRDDDGGARRGRHAAGRAGRASGARSCPFDRSRRSSCRRSSRPRIAASTSTAGWTTAASLRALGANLRAGEVAQGGSTITQQVAKSFLSSERTIQRKIREAIVARRHGDAVHEARHPDAVPEPDLPRPRRPTASPRPRAATSTRRSAISTSARWR